MARLFKNRRIRSGSTAIQLPLGPTDSRPENPVNGQIRFNTDSNRFEIYYFGWKDLAAIGTVNIVKDSFTGDGSQTQFMLSKTPVSANTLLVFVGNVHQNPNDAFTVTGAQITFNTAPPDGQTVIVFHNFASTDTNA
jgi:hypothetical protein